MSLMSNGNEVIDLTNDADDDDEMCQHDSYALCSNTSLAAMFGDKLKSEHEKDKKSKYINEKHVKL